MNVARRSVLGMTTLMMAAAGTRADPAAEAVALWSRPPGGVGPAGQEEANARGSVTNVSRPRLVSYPAARPNGTAALVIAGGGYAHIEAGGESTPACLWLRSLGVMAFELIYRLPGEGWRPLSPFQDGQRAMRIIRAGAARYGYDPARVGVVGFSAGGHLAGMLAVRPDAAFYPPVDRIDDASARPDFAGLIYPVLTMMPPFDHTRAKREIIGERPSDAEREEWSVERHVDARTPPVFLAQAADDPISPVENSRMMYDALRAAKIPAESHVFRSGGHGWGMGRPGAETQAWPGLFADWARGRGFPVG